MPTLHKNYVLDENQNPCAVIIPIAEFALIEKILENHSLTNVIKKADKTSRSGSEIFGMLKHRKPKHPVSVKEMNAAVRQRIYDRF